MDRDHILAVHEKEIQTKIDALNDFGDLTVTLRSALKVTVKRANGSWSKVSMMGGEEFSVNSCYTGKRGGLIFVMKPVIPLPSYAYMEMSASDATDHLKGITELIDSATGMDVEEEVVTKNKEEVEEKHKQTFNNRKHDYDHTFGSW